MDENSPKPVILELSASPAGISAVRIPENITFYYLATESHLPVGSKCLLLLTLFSTGP